MRFLFAMWEGGGTAPPELAVVKRLVLRGHEVRVVGDPTLEDDVKHAGASFVTWRAAPHRSSRTEDGDIVRDWAALTPIGAFARARDRHAFKPALLFARELREAFEAWPADVVVSDAMLFGALVGAEATGAPFAALMPMTSFLPARSRPPASLGLAPARGLAGRIRDRVINAAGEAVIWRSCLPHLERAREAMGLAPISHPLDQLRRANRVLVQTSAWFDFDAPREEGNVVYVGPELGDPAWAGAALSAAASTSPSREPLVLVAFSTTYMGQTKVLARVIDALGELPVRAVVTTGPALDPAVFHAPPNVTVCASASHAELLEHAALVVTHGGHGTVIRALAHGVPIVCMPMGRDQGDNAARVERIGGGIRLSRHASTGKIRHVIADALGDARLGEGARHARDVMGRERHGDAAVEELERLGGARRG